ncbi:MAG: hypothetical protein ACRDRO_00980 [Pseudonocardiaceae bacterium]
MAGELWWDDEDAAHIRSRSARYPGADNLEPDWTLEAAADPHRVVRDPDPRSRVGYTRIIGYSPSVGFVLTVIVDPKDWSGVTAWKTRGADLRDYLENKEPGR